MEAIFINLGFNNYLPKILLFLIKLKKEYQDKKALKVIIPIEMLKNIYGILGEIKMRPKPII